MYFEKDRHDVFSERSDCEVVSIGLGKIEEYAISINMCDVYSFKNNFQGWPYQQDEEHKEHVTQEEYGSQNSVGVFNFVEVEVSQDGTE